MATTITHGDASRRALLRGVDQLADAVRVTLGPRGRNVLLGTTYGSPTLTKDGASVAKDIDLPDPLENVGAQLVKEVASQTADVAGDGTTTATLLAQAIYREGVRNVTAGANPGAIKRGIDRAVAAAVASLASQSKPVTGDMIAQVASLSANHDESIGRIIAEAMARVGKDGVLTVEEAASIDTTLEVVEGVQFDRGYLSPYFVTDEDRMEAVLEDPAILIHEKKIGSLKELLPLLEAAAGEGRPLLIVADDVESEALTTLVVNKIRGSLKVAAIKAPGYGDRRTAMLEDIAALTGGRAITEALGIRLEHVTMADLGRAKKATLTKDRTIIVEGRGATDAIEGRIRQLRVQIEATSSDFDRDNLEKRLAMLASHVAVIKVGAMTETEMKEKKARVEDAVHATRAAVEEGIVPGGGVALIRAAAELDALSVEDDERVGVRIVAKALEAPLYWIASNAGHEGAVVVERVRAMVAHGGFNAQTEVYEDLVAAGIIDPVKVVRVALQNAASMASLLLTTDAAVSRDGSSSTD